MALGQTGSIISLLNNDSFAFHRDRIGVEFDLRIHFAGAVGYVVGPAMQRAGDDQFIQCSFSERSAAMLACVFGGVKLAVYVE